MSELAERVEHVVTGRTRPRSRRRGQVVARGAGQANTAARRLRANRSISTQPRRLGAPFQSQSEALLESAAEGIFGMDAAGNCTFINAAALEMLGFSRDEVLGRDMHGLIHHSKPDGSAYPIEECPINTAFEAGVSLRRIEEVIWRKDGTSFPALYSVAASVGHGVVVGGVVTIVDISGLRAAEEARRASEARFRSLVEATAQVVWVADPSGDLLSPEARWASLTRLPADELAAGWLVAVHPDDREPGNSQWRQSVAAGQPIAFTHRVRQVDQSYRVFQVRAVPVRDHAGCIVEWVGADIDITAQYEAEVHRERRERRTRFLADLGDRMNRIPDPDELLWMVVNATAQEFNASGCLFNEVDLERGVVVTHRDVHRDDVESAAGEKPFDRFDPRSLDDFRAGKTVINRDASTDERTTVAFGRTWADRGVRAFVAVPLMRDGAWAATFRVSHSEPSDWTAEDVELLETVAERAWLAVEHARFQRQNERTLAALEESDGRLRVALRGSPITVYQQNLDLEYTWMYNPSEPFDAQAVVGTRDSDSLLPIEAARLDEIKRTVLETGEVRRELITATTELTGPLMFDLSVEPLLDSAGHIVGVTGAAIDVTQQQARERRIAYLQQVATDLSGAFSASQVAEIVVERGIVAVGANLGAFALLPDPGDEFHLLKSVGYPPEAVARLARVPLSAPLMFSEAVRGGQPLFVETWEERRRQFPHVVDVPVEGGRGAAAVIPMMAEGRAIGALGIAFPVDRPITPEEREFLQALGNLCVPALERARLYDLNNESQRLIAVAEQRFRSTFEHAAVGVTLARTDHTWIDFNPAYEKIVGYPREELMALTWKDLSVAEDAAIEIPLRERMLAGEIDEYTIEKRYRRKDGSHIWVQVDASLNRTLDGGADSVIVVVQNITERRLWQEALRESEERLRFAVDAARSGTWMFNSEVGLRVEEDLRVLLGQPAGPAEKSEDWLDRVVPEDRDALLEQLSAAEVQGVEIDLRVRAIGFDGETRWLRIVGRPVHEHDESAHRLIGLAIDTTAHVAAQENLRRQAQMLDQAYDAIFAWEPEGAISYWNRGAERLYGYSAHEAVGRQSHELLDTTHPIGPAAIFNELATHGAWEGVVTHRRKDGQIVTVETRHQLIEEGDRRFVLEANRDVTDRVRAATDRERLLRRVEEAYAQIDTFVEHAPIGVAFLDRDFRFLRINEWLAQINRKPVEEHLGRPFSEVLPQSAPVIIPLLAEVMETGVPMIDLQLSGPSSQGAGDIRHYLASYFPVGDEPGETIGIGVLIADVTEARRREERTSKLQELTAALAVALDPADVAAAMLDHAREAIGASMAVVVQHADLSLQLVVLGSYGFEAEDLDIWATLPLDTSTVTGSVVLSGEPSVFKSASERLQRFDLSPAIRTASHDGAAVAMPMVVEGRVLGVFSINYGYDRDIDREELDYLRTVADVSAQALERARLYESERQALATAESAEARFRALFEQAADAILIADSNGNYVDVNPAACKMLGYSHAEFLRLQTTDVVAESERQRLLDLRQRMVLGAAHVDEWVFQRKDGSLVPGEVSGQVLSDGRRQAIVRDISERRRIEAALRWSEARYRQTFEQAPIGIVEIGLDRRVQRVNPAYAAMLGYVEKSLVGERFAAWIHPEDIAEMDLAWEALSHAEHDRFTLQQRYVRKDGRVIWVSMTATIVLDDAGIARFVLGVVEDISERRTLERLQDDFLASASHDLKNPLTSIKAQAQVLQRQLQRAAVASPARVIAGLESIDSTSSRMALLIDELIDVTRLRAGQSIELQRQEFDLSALVIECVGSYETTTDIHAFRVTVPPSGVVGNWDARRIERVLGNLLTNAIKYAPAGGEIVVALSVSGRRGGGEINLRVEDRGVGIPQADLPFVFERFRRGTNVGRFLGSGIGLAGARQIVELHDGEITVESMDGQGSVFIVRLPWV